MLYDISSMSIDELNALKLKIDSTIEAKQEALSNPEHYYTESDRASILIGTPDFQISIFNYYGDGTNEIYIYNDPKRWNKDKEATFKGDYKSATLIDGNFYIYPYDCQDPKDLHNTINLNGMYDVYVYTYDFQKPQIIFVNVK